MHENLEVSANLEQLEREERMQKEKLAMEKEKLAMEKEKLEMEERIAKEKLLFQVKRKRKRKIITRKRKREAI